MIQKEAKERLLALLKETSTTPAGLPMQPPPYLETLRKLAEAATPGPWAYIRDRVAPAKCYITILEDGNWCDSRNTAFVAAANPDAILKLIARLEKVEKEYEELRKIIDNGSESMTHADAVQELKYLNSLSGSSCDMTVSMDVSTCDDDCDHRIFGRVTGIQDDMILVEEIDRNF